jgi:hypothetical protein
VFNSECNFAYYGLLSFQCLPEWFRYSCADAWIAAWVPEAGAQRPLAISATKMNLNFLSTMLITMCLQQQSRQEYGGFSRAHPTLSALRRRTATTLPLLLPAPGPWPATYSALPQRSVLIRWSTISTVISRWRRIAIPLLGKFSAFKPRKFSSNARLA